MLLKRLLFVSKLQSPRCPPPTPHHHPVTRRTLPLGHRYNVYVIFGLGFTVYYYMGRIENFADPVKTILYVYRNIIIIIIIISYKSAVMITGTTLLRGRSLDKITHEKDIICTYSRVVYIFYIYITRTFGILVFVNLVFFFSYIYIFLHRRVTRALNLVFFSLLKITLSKLSLRNYYYNNIRLRKNSG